MARRQSVINIIAGIAVSLSDRAQLQSSETEIIPIDSLKVLDLNNRFEVE
jgi:hypothetical protein